MGNDEFRDLKKSKQEEILEKQEKLKDEIKTNLRKTRNLEKEADEKIKELDHKVAEHAISPLIEEMEEKYAREEDVKEYLEAVKKDIIDNFTDFLEKDQQQQQVMPFMQAQQQQPSLRRFEVNIFIDNSGSEGAPLIKELNPTYNSLFGKVEKESQMGTLTTDFSLIKSGSLHRANGGYLIIPVLELFRNPYSWDSLKKALLNKEIRIEEIGEKLGFLTTKSLRPEPIPLNLQIILIGRPEIYQLLSSLSGLPVKQGIAVTGSVNQKGEAQAVGGINEKIEGFYEVCKMMGLTGNQGVIIPQANVRSLMLKQEILQSAGEGKFNIWSVDNIDQGISILTGTEAGTWDDEKQQYQENSVNGLVDAQIEQLATRMKTFASENK